MRKIPYHSSETLGGSSFNDDDEVEFSICVNSVSGEETAKRMRRTKEATIPVNDRKYKAVGEKVVTFLLAKGPDGTRGFAAGRGKAIDPDPSTIGDISSVAEENAEGKAAEDCVKPATGAATEDAPEDPKTASISTFE